MVGHQLGGAAAHVGQKAVAGGAAPHCGSQEGEGGLVRTGEHFHLHTGDRLNGLQGLLCVDDVAQGSGAEDMQIGNVEIIQQGLEAGQHPAGHQDTAVGQQAVFDVAGQTGHLFFVH